MRECVRWWKYGRRSVRKLQNKIEGKETKGTMTYLKPKERSIDLGIQETRKMKQ
jgi:hypothetical protein